jgi:hypothetical protein
MKRKKIFYHLDPKSPSSVENLHVPIKIDTSYSEDSILSSCPVWAHQSSKIFTVYASSNLHLQIDTNSDDYVYSNNLTQNEFNKYIHLRKNWNEGKHSIIQIANLYSNFFWTKDKNIWISILPHPLTSLKNNFYHCGGWFNLSNWPRLINIGAVVVDRDKPMIINRGDPLYYIKFHSKNHNDNFNLIYDEINPRQLSDMYKRIFFVNSKRHSLGFKYQDIIFDSNKTSKCPFRFFRKK